MISAAFVDQSRARAQDQVACGADHIFRPDNILVVAGHVDKLVSTKTLPPSGSAQL
jgi:hypothetical protein